MKKLSLSLMVLVCAQSAQAVSLSDYEYYDYEVRFTNPVCKKYSYESPVKSVGGGLLYAKPKNAYCKKSDGPASANRPDSVQTKLVEWIRSNSTKEIFMTYLSFSNSAIRDELCSAIQSRGLKVTMVLDAKTDLSAANKVLGCKPPTALSENKPVLELRGQENGLGYAHNKLILINPKSTGRIRLVFSSGNMSSGTALHHENWHFITTSAESYFAQAHLCLMNGMLEHASSAAEYKSYIAECKASIEADEESDIKTFFIPGEGEAATAQLEKAVKKSKSISLAAHRFSYSKLMTMLKNHMQNSSTTGKRLRLMTDDDTYWVGTTGEQVGANMANEYGHIRSLTKLGAEVKWMETNHGEILLHHNKYLIFDQRAVFAGAGNLTGDAFTKNLENFYYIEIPEVVSAFREQYGYAWDELATAPEDMPIENILP